MVPLAAVACAKFGKPDGASQVDHMLSLSSPYLQSTFCQTQNAVNKHSHGFRADANELQFNTHPWTYSPKKAEKIDTDSALDKITVPVTSGESPDKKRLSYNKAVSNNEHHPSNGEITRRSLINVQMNGSDDSRMTGSSNPRADHRHLSWFADVATGIAPGPQTSSPTIDTGEKGGSRAPPSHLQGADPLSGRSNFGSGLLGVTPLNQRMYSSQYHLEHLQPSSPTVGAGLSLYYSQAPRSAAAYSGFYQGDPRLQYCTAIPDGLVGNRLSRPYFQGEGLYSSTMATVPSVQLQNSRTQLPHSPSYLQQNASLSPVGSSAGSPSSPHARLSSVQATNLISSRSPEDMVQDKTHMSISVTRNSPQFQHPEDKRTSYSSMESKTQSPVCERLMSTSPYLPSDSQKDLSKRQSTSPSHVPYKVPTGKEGSLKHRILRPPSINIVDPPLLAVQDAPLSAPPIRSSHREPSPKLMRPDGYVGYRSFSTSSSSFVLDGAHINPQVSSQAPMLTSSPCTLSSSSTLASVGVCTGNSSQNVRDGSVPQLKYPAAFMKGSIIQLANSQFKPVEQMTTEDFMECEALSPNLKIDSSTVINVEKMPSSGSAKLVFSVGEKKFRISVEAPLEHPFFVYKQGWSSCCPERSLARYGLNCQKLRIGDTCIFLTVKNTDASSSGGGTSSSSSQNSSIPSPKPPNLVPTSAVVVVASATTSTSESTAENSKPLDLGGVSMISKSTTVSANTEKISLDLTASSATSTAPIVPSLLQQKMSMLSTDSGGFSDGTPPPKRKRRWSFPDRLSSSSSPPSPK